MVSVLISTFVISALIYVCTLYLSSQQEIHMVLIMKCVFFCLEPINAVQQKKTYLPDMTRKNILSITLRSAILTNNYLYIEDKVGRIMPDYAGQY